MLSQISIQHVEAHHGKPSSKTRDHIHFFAIYHGLEIIKIEGKLTVPYADRLKARERIEEFFGRKKLADKLASELREYDIHEINVFPNAYSTHNEPIDTGLYVDTDPIIKLKYPTMPECKIEFKAVFRSAIGILGEFEGSAIIAGDLRFTEKDWRARSERFIKNLLINGGITMKWSVVMVDLHEADVTQEIIEAATERESIEKMAAKNTKDLLVKDENGAWTLRRLKFVSNQIPTW